MRQGVPSLFQSIKVWVSPLHLQVYFQNYPLRYRLVVFNMPSLNQITTTVNSLSGFRFFPTQEQNASLTTSLNPANCSRTEFAALSCPLALISLCSLWLLNRSGSHEK